MGLFGKNKQDKEDPAISMRLSSFLVLRKAIDDNPEFVKTTLDGTIALLIAMKEKNKE